MVEGLKTHDCQEARKGGQWDRNACMAEQQNVVAASHMDHVDEAKTLFTFSRERVCGIKSKALFVGLHLQSNRTEKKRERQQKFSK